MKLAKFAASLLLLVAFRSAFAFTPAQGLWWNPNESGRGYTIDVQNNTMVVTAYVYANAGAATWFISAGNYNSATNSFSGTLYADVGGQCWGCSYTAPTETTAGTLTINFTSPETATINFPGGSTQIQHTVYSYANKTDYFLGEWSLSSNTIGLVEAQWIIFNGHYTGSDGTVYASGSEDGMSGTFALGAYYQSGNYYIAGVCDSNFCNQYIFTLGDDRRMLGLETIYPYGSTPPTPTEPAVANRLLFQSELGGAVSLSHVQSANDLITVNDDAAYAKLAQQMEAARARYEALHIR